MQFDSSKPIQVNADTFLADLNAETGTYRGNVVVVQGDIKLHADEVRVVAPDGKARRMEAHGHVVVDSPSGTAIGDTGIYDVVGRVIHLTGHVVLTKGHNVMRGSALDVHMAIGRSASDGDRRSGKAGARAGHVHSAIAQARASRAANAATAARAAVRAAGTNAAGTNATKSLEFMQS